MPSEANFSIALGKGGGDTLLRWQAWCFIVKKVHDVRHRYKEKLGWESYFLG